MAIDPSKPKPTSDQDRIGILPPRAKILLDMAVSLHHATNMNHLFGQLAKEIVDFFDAECVRLFDYDAVKNEVYTRVKLSDTFSEIKFSVSEQSLAGYTALHNKVVALENVRDLSSVAAQYPGLHYDARYEEFTGIRVRSIISVPMLRNESDLIGIIQLVNTSRPVDRYNTGDIDFLVHIGKMIATAVFHNDERQQRTTKFDLLLEDGIVSPEELTQAIRSARENADDPLGGDPVSVLIDTFGVPHEAMQASLSRYYLTDFLTFDENRIIPAELYKGINAAYFRKNYAVPIELKDKTLTLMISDPYNSMFVNELKQTFLAEHCKLYVGFRKDILKTIDNSLGLKAGVTPDGEPERIISAEPQKSDADKDMDILNEEAPLVVQVVNKLILDAFQGGVSDIHIEPDLTEGETAVRFRKDGVCHRHTQIPATISPAIINRIKILAGMKIEEHRFPQSGKIRLKYGDSAIELRVETTPTVGRREDVVMRILAGSTFLRIDDLDLSEGNRAALMDIIAKPYGILLAVGPTGSGKTTTLHAILHHLNSPERKILTVENPVEITQSGLRQVQVNLNIKPEPFDFAKAMRSFLRADPDIIMVGEMRDKETATIAVEASLTGHFVLSSLHTNSAPDTITRLIQMEIDPLNLADSLLGVLAQRLVRVLCKDCKIAYTPDTAEVEKLTTACGIDYVAACGLEEEVSRLFAPVGCKRCSNTGFIGRAGIYQLLPATVAVKDAITANQNIHTISDLALADGMRTLKMDGIRRVTSGQTTLDEVLKVCID